jgi:hypothetical protein
MIHTDLIAARIDFATFESGNTTVYTISRDCVARSHRRAQGQALIK